MNPSPTGTTRDPVCGMMVDPAAAAGRFEHGGETYFFCCSGCLEKFRAASASFLQPQAPPLVRLRPSHSASAAPAAHHHATPAAVPPEPPAGTLWVCPMGPVAALNHWMASTPGAALQLALATPVVLWAGLAFFARAWASVVNRSPNMFTLIGLGVAVAYGDSIVAVVAPGLFPPALAAHGERPATYFESAAVIVTLVLVGQVLELRARGRTGAALRALLRLPPKPARRRAAGGTERDVPLDQIVKGDQLRVRPGETVPVDGVVVEGESAVDESMLSGKAK